MKVAKRPRSRGYPFTDSEDEEIDPSSVPVKRGDGDRSDAISSVPAKKARKRPDPRPSSESDVDETEIRGSGSVEGRSTKFSKPCDEKSGDGDRSGVISSVPVKKVLKNQRSRAVLQSDSEDGGPRTSTPLVKRPKSRMYLPSDTDEGEVEQRSPPPLDKESGVDGKDDGDAGLSELWFLVEIIYNFVIGGEGSRSSMSGGKAVSFAAG